MYACLPSLGDAGKTWADEVRHSDSSLQTPKHIIAVSLSRIPVVVTEITRGSNNLAAVSNSVLELILSGHILTRTMCFPLSGMDITVNENKLHFRSVMERRNIEHSSTQIDRYIG